MSGSGDLELGVILLALLVSLGLKPWKMLASGDLISPLMATLVFLPWMWALPYQPQLPMQFHWSGAPLTTLLLGWPLATPVLVVVGALTWGFTDASVSDVVSQIVWQGLVPSFFTLLLGAALRRWVSHHLFVYVLGRGFLGSVLSVFVASLIAQAMGHTLPHVGGNLSIIGYWLMAWGDAFLTGMLCAIFVAFKPQWLATWSDRMYLGRENNL